MALTAITSIALARQQAPKITPPARYPGDASEDRTSRNPSGAPPSARSRCHGQQADRPRIRQKQKRLGHLNHVLKRPPFTNQRHSPRVSESSISLPDPGERRSLNVVSQV